MSVVAEVQQRIDEYLNDVRLRLRGLEKAQAQEILAELRSHILERAEDGGELSVDRANAVLKALGSAEELAREYAQDEILARAEISGTPLRLLNGVFEWATMSVAGFVVLIITVIGYFLGVAFVVVAALKPFHPATAGLWSLSDRSGDLELSLRMGFGSVPANGHELLGWSIVPLGMVIGCGFGILTTKFGIWCVRTYRRTLLNRA